MFQVGKFEVSHLKSNEFNFSGCLNKHLMASRGRFIYPLIYSLYSLPRLIHVHVDLLRLHEQKSSARITDP